MTIVLKDKPRLGQSPTRRRHEGRVGVAFIALALLALGGCGSSEVVSDRTAGGTPAALPPESPSQESETDSGSFSGTANSPGSRSEDDESNTVPGEAASGPPILAETPEAAAQGYMNAIVRGDFNSAAQWVTPEQQGRIQALGLGRGPGTQPSLTGSVRVGSVEPTGDTTASISFVGEMCRTAPDYGGEKSKPECVMNRDPETDLNYFKVDVVASDRYGWRVQFPSMEQR